MSSPWLSIAVAGAGVVIAASNVMLAYRYRRQDLLLADQYRRQDYRRATVTEFLDFLKKAERLQRRIFQVKDPKTATQATPEFNEEINEMILDLEVARVAMDAYGGGTARDDAYELSLSVQRLRSLPWGDEGTPWDDMRIVIHNKRASLIEFVRATLGPFPDTTD
jgi:hypothetical protein